MRINLHGSITPTLKKIFFESIYILNIFLFLASIEHYCLTNMYIAKEYFHTFVIKLHS